MRIVAILLSAAALFVAGCGGQQPIQNVQNSPIILPPGKTVSMQQVTTAIMRAGTRLGWQVVPEGPGRLTGRIALRTHMAVVDLEHDTKSYSIKYKDSSNLGYDGSNIHPNYNGWVQRLDQGIRAQLSAL